MAKAIIHLTLTTAAFIAGGVLAAKAYDLVVPSSDDLDDLTDIDFDELDVDVNESK